MKQKFKPLGKNVEEMDEPTRVLYMWNYFRMDMQYALVLNAARRHLMATCQDEGFNYKDDENLIRDKLEINSKQRYGKSFVWREEDQAEFDAMMMAEQDTFTNIFTEAKQTRNGDHQDILALLLLIQRKYRPILEKLKLKELPNVEKETERN